MKQGRFLSPALEHLEIEALETLDNLGVFFEDPSDISSRCLYEGWGWEGENNDVCEGACFCFYTGSGSRPESARNCSLFKTAGNSLAKSCSR